MNKEDILKKLDEYDLSDIDIIDYKEKDALVVRFFYDFDEDIINAAKAYADDECGDSEEDIWYEEFFLPYLSDYAVDEVGQYIEEIMEQFNVEAQFISYEIEKEDYDYSEFLAVFFPKEKSMTIEDVLENLDV